MSPTLTGDAQIGGNDILVIDRLSQVRDVPLERGNVVVIEAPLGLGEGGKAYYEEPKDLFEKIKKFFVKTMYVKRVIGLPGEHMKIESDAIYINGERLNEPYVNPNNSSNRGKKELVVPEGYVFCMGDNRGSSSDSRVFGAIPIEKVEGRIAVRIYPFNKMGKVK
jgi:signal peptidase I